MKEFGGTLGNVGELLRFLVTNPYVRGGAICMGIGGFIRLYSLSKVEVSFAYPFVACSFLLVLIGGYFLGEHITRFRIVGILCILMGIVLISR